MKKCIKCKFYDDIKKICYFSDQVLSELSFRNRVNHFSVIVTNSIEACGWDVVKPIMRRWLDNPDKPNACKIFEKEI